MHPSWLGHAGTIAYHPYGAPPFVARHALVPVAAATPSAPNAVNSAAA
ncbi:hypothetical protein ABT297_25825 [Dactylosporangium sp. NPDC000555]